MVNVGGKQVTQRRAVATGRITLTQDAFDLVIGKPFDPTTASGSFSTGSSATDLSPNASPSHSLVEKAKAKARSKGDVLTVAQLAGIMASKSTSNLIPLCHPLPLTHVHVELVPETTRLSVHCTATVECEGKTGVEMEALTAVSVSLLTVWDMVKAVAGKEMIIGDIMVVNKSGGKSGDWERFIEGDKVS